MISDDELDNTVSFCGMAIMQPISKPEKQLKAQLLNNVLAIDPKAKGVHGRARVVIYDNQKSCFIRKEIVEVNRILELRLDTLDEHLDYK